MRLTRSFVAQPLPVGSTIALPEDAAAHLVRVLRLREGDACIAFNGDGHDYAATVAAIGKRGGSLRIFETDDVLARNRTTAARMQALAQPIAAHRHVADVRQTGMVLAFELTRDGDKATPFDPALRVGLRAYRAALARGVVLRPLGDVLYWMPPYCIDEAQLDLLARVTRDAIVEATACA